jgi:hypothetical protein
LVTISTNNSLNNVEIDKSIIAAKGDLIGASANDTPLVLSSGADGQYLKADSGEATGLVWADISADTNDKVKCSADDTDSNYLDDKLSAGNGVSLAITGGPGDETMTVAVTGGGLAWTADEDNHTMVANGGYITTDDATRVELTLPDTCAVGSVFKIVGEGDAGWKVIQNAGDTIRFGNVATTTGAAGYIESLDKGDCVELVCIVANTDYRVTNAIGNITYS